ncbi:MAG: BamA/TamA family outer membrane protein [Marinifilaceae bacterium]|nr:BamA/TamA family outer membrane protein [Marinifilaceae bacterium]
MKSLPSKYIRNLVLIFSLFIFWNCSTTKFVKEDEYLLNKLKLDLDNKKLSSGKYEKLILQKPNLRILGMWRFHLGLYNLAGKNEKKGINKWLHRIGEKPVIYNPTYVKLTKRQLNLQLQKDGYFDVEISDTLELRRKKAKLTYFIKAKQAYLYDKIYYDPYVLQGNFLTLPEIHKQVNDSSAVRKYIIRDTINSLLKSGAIVDSEVLDKERIRITKMLKNKGYFYFSKSHIHFHMDSIDKKNKIDLFVGLRSSGDKRYLKKCVISSISINTEHKNKLSIKNEDEYLNSVDSILYKDYKFIYLNKLKLNPDVILSSLKIKKSQTYKLQNIEQTYKRLQQLEQFKYINIKFFPRKDNPYQLDCKIYLTPLEKQFYSVEFEGTNRSGNIGFAGNLNYQHKNVFKGAEILDLKFSLAKETVKASENTNFNSSEAGIEAKLNIPKFLMPIFTAEKFREKYNPKTSIRFAYNFQKRPDYTRTIADASFGYNWKSKKYLKHTLNLIQLNYVVVKEMSDNFLESLKNLYIQNSFTNHLIATSKYSIVYNNQNINKIQNSKYFSFNIESAGNSLNLFNSVLNSTKKADYDSEGKLEGKYHDLLGVRYAQYMKFDCEYRYHHYINKANSFVYRIFLGIGYPYGNLKVLPFEKSYFSGGANGIRAWQVRSLGPGSYKQTDTDLPNNSSDVKFETNIEYRYKLIWALEGAFFLDAGNIWSISQKDNREGASFEISNFHKEIAIGTGFGTRVDLNFILFRLDFGIKLRDPSRAPGERWIIGERKFKLNQMITNIAIGYPF